MFCPMCGEELIEIELEEQVASYEGAELYKCDGCKGFGDDYPLVMHHPLGGYRSAPGDSWSLTWLK